MFQKILVAVDGSDKALRAVQAARKIADQFDGHVTLLHVIEHSAYMVPEAAPLPVFVVQDLEEAGQRALDDALALFKDFNNRVTARIEYGHAGATITRIAKDGGYSLIVMGRRGLSGVAKLLMGSVSNYVLHYSECPTLIIKQDSQDR